MRRSAALLEDGRLNPGYLKLDLFCRGLRVAADCVLEAGQEPRRMRSGLGSGLELEIAGARGMRVNAPVVEPFAAHSPYELRGPRSDGTHWLTYEDVEVAEVCVAPTPRFYAQRTTRGVAMSTVGVIQGTYLGVYYGPLCANWKNPELDNCRFCSIGINVGVGDDCTGKTPEDVVETARAARAELGITFVHLNGGFDDQGRYLERFGPVLRGLRTGTGLLTGLQVPPLPDLAQYDELARMGVNNVSLCFEIWDPAGFERVCPGKHRRSGLDRYKEAIEHCARRVRFDTTNGELIAGLEAPSSSMAAIDWLTEVGAVPTVCVFRPVVDTPYADRPPPSTEEMVPVLGHLYRRCMQRGLPIGIAPNVKVSIVMNPEECRWLLPPAERARWPLRRLCNAGLRRAFGLKFRAHMRHRERRA